MRTVFAFVAVGGLTLGLMAALGSAQMDKAAGRVGLLLSRCESAK